MLAQRSIAQVFFALQALLTALLALSLTALAEPHAWAAWVGAAVCTGCWFAFQRARRSVDVAMARLAAQAREAGEARERAEQATRAAIAERDRAGKLEATLLHMQRLEGVGRLAAGVAHDFNNLLTVIGASASMAERALSSGGSPATDLETIQLAVGRASELTQQLLAFARKQVLMKRTVDLNDLVVGVQRMLEHVVGKHATLTTSLSAAPVRVVADAARIEQVLVNLVLNARDALGAAGHIEVATCVATIVDPTAQRLEGLAVGNYACLEVRDNGSGMSEEVQARLFEPFFTTKAPGRGAGLGLATSFGTVRQHDGAIRVESQLGRGTVFRVLLPLTAHVDSVPATADSETARVLAVAADRARVLVVEDEPQVRAIAARALGSAGFDVQQAAHGALGLALLREQAVPFDVLVTDVVMPELDGRELARAARALDPNLGLIFMSGFPEAMHSARADEFPDAAFLSKPFAPRTLVEAVQERLQIRSQRRPG